MSLWNLQVGLGHAGDQVMWDQILRSSERCQKFCGLKGLSACSVSGPVISTISITSRGSLLFRVNSSHNSLPGEGMSWELGRALRVRLRGRCYSPTGCRDKETVMRRGGPPFPGFYNFPLAKPGWHLGCLMPTQQRPLPTGMLWSDGPHVAKLCCFLAV